MLCSWFNLKNHVPQPKVRGVGGDIVFSVDLFDVSVSVTMCAQYLRVWIFIKLAEMFHFGKLNS